jgi:hypothetical protein
MCDPKPIIFLRISFLNPVTVATEMIMTARLKAMPVTEIRMIGPDNDFLFSLWKESLLAMNNPVFKPQGCLSFKDINLRFIIIIPVLIIPVSNICFYPYSGWRSSPPSNRRSLLQRRMCESCNFLLRFCNAFCNKEIYLCFVKTSPGIF